jgi:hypothetical protein
MSAFTKAIEHYCDGLHVATGAAASCQECRDSFGCDDDASDDDAQEYLYQYDEAHFSWSQCDSCGSTLGGDRHAAHGIPHGYKAGDDSIIHLDICTDCLLFHANGDEPESWEPRP